MDENKLISENKKFKLFDRELNIPTNLATFNSYRLIYRNLALQATDELEYEYNNSIHNLDEFLASFPMLYKSKLDSLIKKSIDILISEGIWTVTYDSFLESHLNDFHLAMDDYRTMVDNFNLVLEENQRKKATMWGYIPNLIGGGFGIIGALKGIATATAYNLIRNGIEESSLKNANVKPEQRAQIYNYLNTSLLFDRVFSDYWNVFLSLVWTLNQNGKNIWWPNNKEIAQAENIFANLSNPNFPQDKVIDAILQIIQVDPYNEQYYTYMIEKFGDTEEIHSIKQYFGYST